MACNNSCSTCKLKGNCSKEKNFFQTTKSNIRKIIAVVSGKGGVGKSTVTSLLANQMRKRGYKVGILDADITGPSIPTSFGVHQRVKADSDNIMIPEVSQNGVKIMSVNLLLERESQAVIWRGPILGNAVKQFYSETAWQDLDYLFIDMPPGTSDVGLTVFNNIPINGAVLVSSPQDLVEMIVSKAISMLEKMNIKMVGLVENMAYVKCPHCDEKIFLYGPSKLNEVALKYHLVPLASLGIDPSLTKLMDEGNIEDYNINLDTAIGQIEML